MAIVKKITSLAFPIYLIHMIVFNVFEHIHFGPAILHLVVAVGAVLVVPFTLKEVVKTCAPKLGACMWGGR